MRQRLETILVPIFFIALFISIFKFPAFIGFIIFFLRPRQHYLYPTSWIYYIFPFLYLFCVGFVLLTIRYVVQSLRKQMQRSKIISSQVKDLKQQVDLTLLIQEDQGFSTDKFLVRAKKIYTALIHAIAHNDSQVLRLLLNPQEMDLIEEVKFLSSPGAVSKPFIREAHLVRLEKGATQNFLVVAMLIEINLIKDGKLKQKLLKKCHLTFNRITGLQTSADSDLFDTEHCPNCGAPLDISVKGICHFCNNEVSSGKFHWNIYDLAEEIIETISYK